MSLAKELYDVTAEIRRINVKAQGDGYADDKVTRDAVKKLTNEASNLAAWLYPDAR